MNVADWTRIYERISDTWGSRASENQAGAWYVELQGEQVADVRNAVTTLIRTEDRKPSVAKILQESRNERKKRNVGLQSFDPPGTLPEGVVAIIKSKNYQDWAIEGHAPWSLAASRLPENIEITEIIGVQPVGPQESRARTAV